MKVWIKISALLTAACLVTVFYTACAKEKENQAVGEPLQKNSPEQKLEDNNQPDSNHVVKSQGQVNQSSQSASDKQTVAGERLNFTELDKLSNQKYGWGLSLYGNGKTPGITATAKNLLSAHQGIYIGDTSKKAVYLTFDEGYENGYTAAILDTLKKNDVQSIFFITGAYLKQNKSLVQRMLDEGHLVGNHTINHPSLPTVSNAVLEKELAGMEDQYKKEFGVGFHYLRPPMGEYSERTLAAAQQMGYKTVFWSFAYLDYDVNKQKGADYAYSMVMNNLHDGAVILLHAVSKDNSEALDRIIHGIREQGYTISPFDL